MLTGLFSGGYFGDYVMLQLREWHCEGCQLRSYDLELLPLYHEHLLDMVDTL